MVEQKEARQHIYFGPRKGGLINKAKHAVWKCVTPAVNEVGQKHITVAAIEMQWSV